MSRRRSVGKYSLHFSGAVITRDEEVGGGCWRGWGEEGEKGERVKRMGVMACGGVRE